MFPIRDIKENKFYTRFLWKLKLYWTFNIKLQTQKLKKNAALEEIPLEN